MKVYLVYIENHNVFSDGTETLMVDIYGIYTNKEKAVARKKMLYSSDIREIEIDKDYQGGINITEHTFINVDG